MFFLGRANCHVFRGKLLDLEICFNLNIHSFKKISMILKSNCRNNQSKKSILKGILHENTPSAFLSMQYEMTVLVWQNSICSVCHSIWRDEYMYVQILKRHHWTHFKVST